MYEILLSPPIAFLIFLGLTVGLSVFCRGKAARGADSPRKKQAYACGEALEQNQAPPDYSEFFQFAFFFTVMHVIVLTVATSPSGLTVASGFYLGVTVLALFMLLRRD